MAKNNLKINNSDIDDLKEIKKLYGEAFMKMCRKFFPTILDSKGELKRILTEYFEPSKTLAKDIIENSKEGEFQSFVYSKFNKNPQVIKKSDENPFELMKKAEYTLYECKNNEDVLSFKKYYNSEEAICTFKDKERIENYYIFFALKDNLDQIKREDYYSKRKRQDPYGTSVISLQFRKPIKDNVERQSFLSIKNRWNHSITESNPDATFSNDLENIKAGLTDSFEKYLNIKLPVTAKRFEMCNYIADSKGKFYRYNNEINGRYYCENNIILNGGDVIRVNPDEYLLLDYFLIDKKNGKVWDVNECKIDKDFPYKINKKHNDIIYEDLDSFPESLGNIQKIEIEKHKDEQLDCDRVIKVTTPEGQSKLYINSNNGIVKYDNPYVKEIGNNFCGGVSNLKSVNLLNNEKIGSACCYLAENLQEFIAPNNLNIGNDFCGRAHNLSTLELSSNKKIGNQFCKSVYNLKTVNLPNNEEIGDYCCYNVGDLEEFVAQKNKKIGNDFCVYAPKLKSVELISNEEIGSRFCGYAKNLQRLIAPKNKRIGNAFCEYSHNLEKLDLNSNEEIGDYFCVEARKLQEFVAPKNKKIGNGFFQRAVNLKKVDLKNNEKIGNMCCISAVCLEEFLAPKNKKFGAYFCGGVYDLKRVDLSSVEEIGLLPFDECKNIENLLTKNNELKHLVNKSFVSCKITAPEEWE